MNYRYSGLLEGWRRLPGTSKLILLAIAAVVAVALITGTGGLVSKWKDRRFEARESERVRERDELQRDRDAAIGRAELLEKQAEDLKVQAQIYQTAATAAGTRATEIAERLKNEDENFQSQVTGIDASADYCERVRRICATARRLYPSRPESPECRECAAKSQ